MIDKETIVKTIQYLFDMQLLVRSEDLCKFCDLNNRCDENDRCYSGISDFIYKDLYDTEEKERIRQNKCCATCSFFSNRFGLCDLDMESVDENDYCDKWDKKEGPHYCD